jgi:hypothetical protein
MRLVNFLLRKELRTKAIRNLIKHTCIECKPMKTTALFFTGVLFLLLSCKNLTRQEPAEVSQINAMVDSLKRITNSYQNIPYKDAAGNSTTFHLAKASENGTVLSYKEYNSTAYYGSDGTVMFVEITNWDAVQKNTQYLEQYYLRSNKPFYFRKFGKSLQDSSLLEAGETSVIPDTWSFKLVTRDEMLKAMEANSLNYSSLAGKWFEVTEIVGGDKSYEITRFCDAEPFNITFEGKSILINPGQMATRYSILSIAQVDDNLKLTTLDSLSGSGDPLEYIVAASVPGVIMFFQNEERKVLVHERSLALVSIKEDRSDCEQ